MEKLQEIKEELLQLVSKNEKEKMETKSKISELENEVKVAKNKIIKAENDVDIELNKEGQKQLWEAEQTLKLFNKILNKLENEPLISKEKHHKLIKEIQSIAKSEQEKLIKEFKEKILDLEPLAVKSDEIAVEYETIRDTLVRKVSYIDSQNHPYNQSNTGGYAPYLSDYNNGGNPAQTTRIKYDHIVRILK